MNDKQSLKPPFNLQFQWRERYRLTKEDPIIGVSLGEFDVYALIDSGAQISILEASYSNCAGIKDIESGELVCIQGIAEDEFHGYIHDISFSVAGRNISCPAVIVDKKYIPERLKVAAIIIGREDVFDKLGIIAFDETGESMNTHFVYGNGRIIPPT